MNFIQCREKGIMSVYHAVVGQKDIARDMVIDGISAGLLLNHVSSLLIDSCGNNVPELMIRMQRSRQINVLMESQDITKHIREIAVKVCEQYGLTRDIPATEAEIADQNESHRDLGFDQNQVCEALVLINEISQKFELNDLLHALCVAAISAKLPMTDNLKLPIYLAAIDVQAKRLTARAEELGREIFAKSPLG
jgi:hypothetical protein